MKQLNQVLRELGKKVDRPWYLPAIGGLAAADLFVGVIPTDAFVVSTALARPRRWLRPALTCALGSTLGALALAMVTTELGPAFISDVLGYSLESDTWTWIREWLRDYGVWALALISFGPTPQQPAIALGAIGGMGLPAIALSVGIGRGVKYVLLALIAARAPATLRKLKWLDPEIDDLEEPKKS